MATTTGFRLKSLAQQGYQYSERQLLELEWGLRFTPAVCMLAAVWGLVSQQWMIHAFLALLGIGSFWLRTGHPLDLFYNALLRPIWDGVKLPPSPLPRKIACLIGGCFNGGIAFSFFLGMTGLAYVLGAVLIPLQVLVITTHFCLASWMYEGFMALIGRRVVEVEIGRAVELLSGGGKLLDVRPAHQFQKDAAPGAVNVPLSELPEHYESLAGNPVLVYCQMGVSSQKATRLLREHGLEEVYNVGSLARAKKIRQADG